jgi:hypothetical protein
MELLMGRWVGGQNRFWIGLGYRLAPRECFSRHAVQEEVSQAEPVPVQPQTIPIRRIFLKGKGHVSMPFFRFYAGRNKRIKQTTCSMTRQTPWPSRRLRTPDRAALFQAATGLKAPVLRMFAATGPLAQQ